MRPRENKTSFSRPICPEFFFPISPFVIWLWSCLLSWVQTTYESTCVNFFSAIRTRKKIAESRAKFHKFCFAKNFWKNLSKWLFPEIPRKNLHWVWDKTRQISGQTDEYSPRKKIKQFHTQANLPFSPDTDE